MPTDAAARISLLVAEDEPPLREALVELVGAEAGLELVAAVGDAEAAVERAAALHPDVALIDVRMPGGGGPHAAAGICAASPNTRVVALTAYEDRATVLMMLRAGATSYVVKGTAPDEILDAVRRAARGQASLSADILRDLTSDLVADAEERDKTIDALRRSEVTYRGLLETAPDGVVIIDEHGRIVLVNTEAERMFGYSREQLLGMGVDQLLPDRFRSRHARHRTAYLADPRSRPMGAGIELAGLRSNGTEFPVDISLSALETDGAQLASARIRDITESRVAEETQRKSERRFAALLESAPDAVVIIDSSGSIVLVNHMTEELFGFGRDELLGRPVEQLLPERFRDRHVGHRSTYAADPRTRPMGAGLELAGRRKDGSEFPIHISLAALETEEGQLLTAFVRDITERQARDDLERDLAERRALLEHLVTAAEDERRRIAGDIHDDSIQVITAAGMRLQLLRRRLDDPEALELLAKLEETIQLSIARLRHLLFELRPPVLDSDGLSAALELYMDEAERESGIRHHLDDRLGAQPAEQTRVILYRIAQEALTNVRKHARPTEVKVSLREQDGGYAVQVADDGVGFTQAAERPTPGHLGLASMRERASMAGGWMRVSSEPGQGTSVDVWIPAMSP